MNNDSECRHVDKGCCFDASSERQTNIVGTDKNQLNSSPPICILSTLFIDLPLVLLLLLFVLIIIFLKNLTKNNYFDLEFHLLLT